jgi:hypothetical protein
MLWMTHAAQRRMRMRSAAAPAGGVRARAGGDESHAQRVRLRAARRPKSGVCQHSATPTAASGGGWCARRAERRARRCATCARRVCVAARAAAARRAARRQRSGKRANVCQEAIAAFSRVAPARRAPRMPSRIATAPRAAVPRTPPNAAAPGTQQRARANASKRRRGRKPPSLLCARVPTPPLARLLPGFHRVRHEDLLVGADRILARHGCRTRVRSVERCCERVLRQIHR